MADIVFRCRKSLQQPAERLSLFHGQGLVGEHQRFNLLLQIVAELKALRREDLDAVILVGIVGSRNHHARICMVEHREIRHGRRGQYTKMHRIGAAGTETGDQRTLQHIRGNAGVLAQDNCRRTAFGAAKADGGGLTDAVGQITSQRFVGNATNTVRSE